MRLVAAQTAFKHVHPSLLLCLEQASRKVTMQTQGGLSPSTASSSPEGHDLALLMDFSRNTYATRLNASPPQTTQQIVKSIPAAAPPRVPDNETFNFDFGALDCHMSDQSYMAWF